jgi:hypothetical protein
MKLHSAVARVFAFAATIALVASLWATALAIYGAEWFWTTENDQNPITFQQCLERAPSALATTGVASGRNGNFFYVDSPDFHVVLLCINRSRGMNMTLKVAVGGGSRTAVQIGSAINSAFWGTQTPNNAGVPNLAGRYTCVGPCTSPQGTASVAQNGNELTFISEVGGRSTGRFLDARTIVADGWGIRATISADLRTINWSNGVQWVRQ